MADITAVATLDAEQFSKGLSDALKQAKAWRRDVESALDFSPLDRATDSSKNLKKALNQVTKGMTTAAQQASGAADGVSATTKAATQAGLGMDELKRRIEAAQTAMEAWRGSSDKTEASFNKLKQEALGLVDSAIKVDGASAQQVAALQKLRAELEASTFAEAQANQAREDATDAVIKYRNATLALYNEVRTGVVGAEEGKRLAIELRDASMEAAQSTERWSAEYRQLLVASGRAESILAQLEGRVTAVGHSQSIALGTSKALGTGYTGLAGQTRGLTGVTNGLATSYQQLGSVIASVAAAAGLTRYVQMLTKFSGEASAARNTLALWNKEAAAAGITANEAGRAVTDLAGEFRTTEDAVASNITLLVNYGASLDQAINILRRGAASALAAGLTAAEGFNAVTEAITAERSGSLRRIGIASRLTVAYSQYAKEIGKTTSELTAQQKVQTALNNVLNESDIALDSLGMTLGSFVGAQGRASESWKKFQRSLGEGAEAFLRPVLNLVSSLLDAFTSLPAPLRNAVTSLGLLAVSVAGIATAYATLQVMLVKTKVLQTVIGSLLSSEIVLRSRLGAALLTLSGRYKLLTAEQLKSAAAQRTALGASSGWGAAMAGVGRAAGTAAKGVGRLTVAAVGFIATPLGATLAAIVAVLALIVVAVRRNQQIIKPAMDALNKSIQSVKDAFGALWETIKSVFAEGTVLGSFLKNTLIFVATQTAHVIARLARAFGVVAARVQFFNDLLSKGPRVAMANYQAAIIGINAEYAELTETITATARASRDGTLAIEEQTAAMGDAGDSAEDLAAKMKQAESSLTGFQERFRDMKISLMADGMEKDLAGVREEFRRLRNEIRAAAEDNEQFKPFEAALIAEAFELEQQRILEIQADYARQRQEEAEKQATELADAIGERERAIVDAQTKGRLNQADALTLEYQRRIEDTEKLYSTLIKRARDYGQDTARLEELRGKELAALHQGHARDVLAIYDDLFAELTDRQRNLVRGVAEAAGDDRSLLGLNLAKDLSDLTKFYADARKEAVGNADLMAALDAQEAAERQAAHTRYWNGLITLTGVKAQAVNDREEQLARKRAELAGDQAEVLRLAAARELRDINAAYDQLEVDAAGNADELVRIASLRNQEIELANAKLAKSLQGLSDAAFAEAQSPLIEALTRDLDTASAQTLTSVETQLKSWRAAYGSNGEVVKLIDAALGRVTDAQEKAAEDASRAVHDLIESVSGLTDDVFTTDAQRGLSTLDKALATAAERANQLREKQEQIAAQLLITTGAEREALLQSAQDVQDALDITHRNIAADAEKIVRDAFKQYQAGLEEAKREASAAAVDMVLTDVKSVIGNLTALQTNALEEARVSLMSAIATLSSRGVDTAALQPLHDQLSEIDAILSTTARVTADFAAEQMTAMRTTAQAVLSEADAQKVAHETYRETIRLRKAALEEAKREGTTLNELTTLTKSLTDAQLAYVSSLQSQISTLQNLKGQYQGVFGAAADLAALLDKPVPESVIKAQGRLADAELNRVQQMQASGQTFVEYGADLQNAINLWREFQAASTTAIDASAKQLKQQFSDAGGGGDGIFSLLAPNENRVTDIARRITEGYDIGIKEAKALVTDFVTGATDDLLGGLEARDPTVLSEILTNLNDEATKTPGVIDSIDTEIQSLTEQLETLKTDIAEAVDFDAAGERLISGYKSVLEAVEGVTGESFDAAAEQAVGAFLERLGKESERLKNELTQEIGAAATAAGELAGRGLMTAFAAGVTANKGALLAAVERVLREVRQRLPSSDAKTGPLSDLTHSGRMLVSTFMTGAMRERSRLASRMDELLQVARPGAAFTAAAAHAGGAGGLSRGPVSLTVDARRIGTPGGMAVNARRLVADVERELRLKGYR